MKCFSFIVSARKISADHLRRLLLIAGLLMAVAFAVCRTCVPVTVFSTAEEGALIPVIDAGHGGPDGGAVSRTGLLESGINLSIAKKLEMICRLYGVPAQMTRREDVSLHDASASTLRQKKNSDLKNRVNLVNSLDRVLLISIHQNAFTDSRYKGAQVFYSRHAQSKPLSERIQSNLKAALDPENGRVPARSDAYLIEQVTCPAVLVECGFLSNIEEAALLGEDAYQSRIAMAVAASYFSFSTETQTYEP